jgi:hypothetical protein
MSQFSFKSFSFINSLLFLLVIVLSACENDATTSHKINPKKTENILKGSEWSSEFYYYHNRYFFKTNSSGYSEDGQYGWSTAIDPEHYNNSKDSILYEEKEAFTYKLVDTVLTITYKSKEEGNEPRIFYLEKRKNKEVVFRSEYEYTYGREYLFKAKSPK